jgi:hypothetical protein
MNLQMENAIRWSGGSLHRMPRFARTRDGAVLGNQDNFLIGEEGDETCKAVVASWRFC